MHLYQRKTFLCQIICMPYLGHILRAKGHTKRVHEYTYLFKMFFKNKRQISGAQMAGLKIVPGKKNTPRLLYKEQYANPVLNS